MQLRLAARRREVNQPGKMVRLSHGGCAEGWRVAFDGGRARAPAGQVVDQGAQEEAERNGSEPQEADSGGDEEGSEQDRPSTVRMP